jgi:hypothetical protein
MKRSVSYRYAALLFLGTICASCGGGGGGGEAPGADVGLALSSGRIAVGEDLLVEVSLVNKNPYGILLKMRYPDMLRYRSGTATMRVRGTTLPVEPAFEQQLQDGRRYLVFFFYRDQFGSDQLGELAFLLRGNAAIEEGLIEVDAAPNDPLLPDRNEFDTERPQFEADDEGWVTVR